MKSLKKNIVFGTLLLIGAAAQISCDFFKKKEQPIKVGILPTGDCFPIYYAKKMDFFTKAGIELETVSFKSAVERDSLLVSGGLDAASGDLIATSIMKSKGFDVKVVAMTLGDDQTRRGVSLLASKNIKSAEDLKGGSLAISQNTIIEYLADRLLAKIGLKETDVTKVNVGQIALRVSLLKAGKIAATILPDPIAVGAQAEGANLLTDDSKSHFSHAVLVFRSEAIHGQRSKVAAILDVVMQVVDDINSRPEHYKSEIADFCNVPANLIADFSVARFASKKLPSHFIFNDTQDWLVSTKRIEKALSYDDLVDQSFGFTIDPRDEDLAHGRQTSSTGN